MGQSPTPSLHVTRFLEGEDKERAPISEEIMPDKTISQDDLGHQPTTQKVQCGRSTVNLTQGRSIGDGPQLSCGARFLVRDNLNVSQRKPRQYLRAATTSGQQPPQPCLVFPQKARRNFCPSGRIASKCCRVKTLCTRTSTLMRGNDSSKMKVKRICFNTRRVSLSTYQQVPLHDTLTAHPS